MRSNVFVFDLDDTLIDTRRRHFNVVNDFLNAHGNAIEFEEYIGVRKKNHWSNKQVVQEMFMLDPALFMSFWMANIESPGYLKHDIEFVDCPLMTKFKSQVSADFILLSLRSNTTSAKDQFRDFRVSSLFDETFFLKHASLNPKIEHLNALKKAYGRVTFVSDSQEDFNAAQAACVDFAGVKTGIYDIVCPQIFDDINSFLLKYCYDI